MWQETGKRVDWARFAERLWTSAGLPALVLRGSWENRPPAATPQRGAFSLVHVPTGRWVLEQPTGSLRLVGDGATQVLFGEGGSDTYRGDEGWVREPAGLLAATAAWFPRPDDNEVLEVPGRETVAGRACSRFVVKYSPHSTRVMALWLDDEWPLVLAARSVSGERTADDRRFEVHVSKIEPASPSEARRYSTTVAETLDRAPARPR